MFAIDNVSQVSAFISRHIVYTNGNTIVIKTVGANNAQTSYSLSGDDFSGTVYNNTSSTITIRKAGTYEINNNGTISTQVFMANDSLSLPAYNVISIRKIK